MYMYEPYFVHLSLRVPGQGMVVDGECEVIIAGGLSQPHIVERIQSSSRHVPRLGGSKVKICTVYDIYTYTVHVYMYTTPVCITGAYQQPQGCKSVQPPLCTVYMYMYMSISHNSVQCTCMYTHSLHCYCNRWWRQFSSAQTPMCKQRQFDH